MFSHLRRMYSWKIKLVVIICAIVWIQQLVAFTDHTRKNVNTSQPLKYSLNPTMRKRTSKVGLGSQRSSSINRKHDIYQTSEDWWRQNVTEDVKRNLYLEIIKQKILTQTGLEGPVNMTGVVLPLTPGLTKLINNIQSHFEHPRKQAEDLPLNDEPAPRIETSFFIAKRSPLMTNQTTEEVIMFNLKHEQSTRLAHARINFWLRPLRLEEKDTSENYLKKKSKARRSKARTTIIIWKINGISGKQNRKIYKSIQSHKKGKWLSIEITSFVKGWLQDPETNFGLTISTKSTGDHPMVISGISDDLEKVPVLEIQQNKYASGRLKRFANNRVCSTNTEKVCCKDELIVDFIDLHWDFIVAPKKYEANLCRGDCPFLFAQQYPHSSLVQKIFNVTDARFGACCGAREMDPLIMIYYDGQAIKVSTIRDMVVIQCGCS